MFGKLTKFILFISFLFGLAPFRLNNRINKYYPIICFINVAIFIIFAYIDFIHILNFKTNYTFITNCVTYLHFISKLFTLSTFYVYGFIYRNDLMDILELFSEIDQIIMRKTVENKRNFSVKICINIFQYLTMYGVTFHFMRDHSLFEMAEENGFFIIIYEFTISRVFILLITTFIYEFQHKYRLVNEFLQEILFLINNKLILPPHQIRFAHKFGKLWLELVENGFLQNRLRKTALKLNAAFQMQTFAIFCRIFLELVLILYVVSVPNVTYPKTHCLILYNFIWTVQILYDMYVIIHAYCEFSREVRKNETN